MLKQVLVLYKHNIQWKTWSRQRDNKMPELENRQTTLWSNEKDTRTNNTANHHTDIACDFWLLFGTFKLFFRNLIAFHTKVPYDIGNNGDLKTKTARNGSHETKEWKGRYQVLISRCQCYLVCFSKKKNKKKQTNEV
jgi:hypothetical protein